MNEEGGEARGARTKAGRVIEIAMVRGEPFTAAEFAEPDRLLHRVEDWAFGMMDRGAGGVECFDGECVGGWVARKIAKAGTWASTRRRLMFYIEATDAGWSGNLLRQVKADVFMLRRGHSLPIRFAWAGSVLIKSESGLPPEPECTGTEGGNRCTVCLSVEEHGHATIGRAPNCRSCPACGERAYGSSKECYGWGEFYCAGCRTRFGRSGRRLSANDEGGNSDG